MVNMSRVVRERTPYILIIYCLYVSFILLRMASNILSFIISRSHKSILSWSLSFLFTDRIIRRNAGVLLIDDTD